MTRALAAAAASGIARATSAPSAKRCVQCFKRRAWPEMFIGARGTPILRCRFCQRKYRSWSKLSLEQRAAHARARPASLPVGGHRVMFNLRSGNRKTGPIPVSITDPSSCPTSCAFFGNGCYAAYGHLGWHWRTTSTRGLSWRAFCARVAELEPGTVWRHNEAGDLPGEGEDIDRFALNQLVRANEGRRGFTFTHKPVLRNLANRRAIRGALARGFTINLSADSLAHADELAALELAPVAVVLAHDAPPRATRTPAGRKVVVCPAQTSELTCERCRLCAAPQRKAIVGFLAHGQFKARVSELVQLRRAR